MKAIGTFAPPLQQAVEVWPLLSNVVFVPHTEAEYEQAVSLLEQLIDEVGEDETHPLASLMETVGTLIESYEAQHFPEPVGTPIGALKMLMEEHNLQAADLPEFGDQNTAREILEGKRSLSAAQIHAFSRRFHVSPLVFV